MIEDVFLSPAAEDDLAYWRRMGDRGKIKRILKLIEDTQTHGYGGIGKPEPLVEERFKGFWSKRIDKEHRMIFRIDGGVLQIASCRTHYKK